MRDGIGDWPQNLLDELQIEPADELDRLGDSSGNVEIAMMMSTLTPREKEAVRLRYQDELSIREVAERFGLSTERCRQIINKGIRKLRHPRVADIIRYGIRAYIQDRIDRKVEEIVRQKEAALETAYQAKLEEIANNAEKAVEIHDVSRAARAMGMTVEELNLSLRAYNCMKRAYCNTVADIVQKYPTMDNAKRIRNLGAKSLQEVTEKLRSLGVDWPKVEE